MSNLSGRAAAIRAVIGAFLLERRDAKLDKLPDDDPKRAELLAQFQPAAWIEDAARRASQIQAVTHTLKPIHPDAKGSNLFCRPEGLAPLNEVGSHCLADRFKFDFFCHSGAKDLDVVSFLKRPFEGQTLLTLLLGGDPDAIAALSDQPEQAQAWAQAFTALTAARGHASSHTLAKQLYWLVGEDPLADADFHLLAPLYPSALVQRVYEQLQNDRFSDDAKAARQARKAGEFHERPTRDYLNLAVQKLGGTKPQNISQLNSERLGQNFLLASLPPTWLSREAVPLWRTDTLFTRFGRRPEVRQTVKALHTFLATQPPKTMDTRDARDELADVLVDEFLLLGATLRELLPPGWSQDALCRLPDCEKVWLDSVYALPDDTPSATGPAAEATATAAPPPPPNALARPPTPLNWADELAARYANWLNAALGTTEAMKMGDPEHAHWQRDLRDALAAYEWELNHVA